MDDIKEASAGMREHNKWLEIILKSKAVVFDVRMEYKLYKKLTYQKVEDALEVMQNVKNNYRKDFLPNARTKLESYSSKYIKFREQMKVTVLNRGTVEIKRYIGDEDLMEKFIELVHEIGKFYTLLERESRKYLRYRRDGGSFVSSNFDTPDWKAKLGDYKKKQQDKVVDVQYLDKGITRIVVDKEGVIVVPKDKPVATETSILVSKLYIPEAMWHDLKKYGYELDYAFGYTVIKNAKILIIPKEYTEEHKLQDILNEFKFFNNSVTAAGVHLTKNDYRIYYLIEKEYIKKHKSNDFNLGEWDMQSKLKTGEIKEEENTTIQGNENEGFTI